jgi:hypothetical protein
MTVSSSGSTTSTGGRELTLLADDSVSGTINVLLGLSGLDLGLTLVVPVLAVLGQDARLGRSSDGLELRA